ncbi:MAG: tetratricopeptide repeat protein [Proteobacteria bacterium]|nr:tetratricopeptide repeat protein [Pseudomonadota bacterium]
MKKLLIISFLILTLTGICFANDPLSEGFLLVERGEYAKAFSIFSSIKSESPQVLTGKGIAKYFIKDYPRSIYYLEKSLRYDSEKKNWIPNFFAGLSWYELGDYNKALFYFNVSYTLNPSSETSLWIGKTLYNQGNYIEAEKFLLETLNKNKQNEEVYEKLLFIYFKFDEIKKLEDLIQMGRREAGDLSIFSLYEAKIFVKKGEIERAKEVFKKLPKDKYQKEIDELISTAPILEKKDNKLSKMLKKAFQLKWESKTTQNLGIIIALLTLLGIGLFYRNRKKDIQQKIEFANELLKANDLKGCEEILESIRAPYPEKYKITKLKLLTLKGEYFSALDLCDELNDQNIKETLKAYIYLLGNDIINFDKHIDYIELILDKQRVEEISNLKYLDVETLKKSFINLFTE